jgi:prophage regulatory protein
LLPCAGTVEDAMLKTRNGDLIGSDSGLDRIMRRAEVERVTGLSRATIYAHVAEGTFPPPVRITTKSIGWRESDVRSWLARLPTVAIGGDACRTVGRDRSTRRDA